MVRRWRDEIILGLVMLGCSACGGYFGAKMAQIDGPKASATYDSPETFGTLRPLDSAPTPPEQQPPVIVIVVNDSSTIERHGKPAIYRLPRTLNPIQKPVNFI